MLAWVLVVACGALRFPPPHEVALLSAGADGRKGNATSARLAANCTAAGAAARSSAARQGSVAVEAAAHNAATCAVGTQNASHQVRANATTASVFRPSCAAACDSCFATHLMACSAMCYEGLQAYCRKVCTTSTSCSPKWSASPVTGNGVDKKFCDGHVDIDGCPTQNYDR